ncbi:MAG: hypothetical protein QY314_03640 [Candidatus Dojkabacteria bacterium]|nr:MAG: hypothetical protein QY314_03640 [Candidatus Dojkabacteria bacterium]
MANQLVGSGSAKFEGDVPQVTVSSAIEDYHTQLTTLLNNLVWGKGISAVTLQNGDYMRLRLQNGTTTDYYKRSDGTGYFPIKDGVLTLEMLPAIRFMESFIKGKVTVAELKTYTVIVEIYRKTA